MFDMTDRSPLLFGKYGPHIYRTEGMISGDIAWQIIGTDQKIKAKYTIDGGPEQVGEFKLSDIKSVNPLSRHGMYLLSFNIENLFVNIVEDTVPAPCALEGHILMLGNGRTEGDVDIYEVPGYRLKDAMYRTQNRGLLIDVEYYTDGKLTAREYVSIIDDGIKNRIIDDAIYFLRIYGGEAFITMKTS